MPNTKALHTIQWMDIARIKIIAWNKKIIGM